MRALLRPYGALGSALVVGLEDAGRMTAISTLPVSEGPDGVYSTVGDPQRSGEEDTPFALFWRSGSRSNLLEAEGFLLELVGPLFARRDEYGKTYRRRYRHFLWAPPELIVELDPTAEVLLDQAAQFAGLGYAARCMSAWWYVTERDDEGYFSIDHRDPSAAAIESLVSKRLGMRTMIPALADHYQCSVEAVRRHGKRLQGYSKPHGSTVVTRCQLRSICAIPSRANVCG
jgi:hypothetical protein